MSSVFVESPLKCMVYLSFFFFRVPRLRALTLLNTGWPSSWNLCTILSAKESHSVRRFPIPLLFRPRTYQRPVSLREFHRVFLDFFCIRDTILIILSFWPINVIEHWHEDDLVLELFGFHVLSHQYVWVSWRIANDENPGKYSTRIQLLLHRFPLLRGKNDTSWVLPLDLPILLSLLCLHSSVPDIEWNLHRQTPWPSPIWSRDHEIILISSRTEMNFPAILHSEFIQNVPSSTSE